MKLIEDTKVYTDGVVDTMNMVQEKYDELSEEDFADWLISYIKNANELRMALGTICGQKGSEDE